jgi:hypothetical protein
MTKGKTENKGIIISGGKLEADQIAVGDHASAVKNIGVSSEPAADDPVQAALAQWQAEIEARLDALTELQADEKDEIRDKIRKVQAEAGKGQAADPNKIERLINTMAVMAPDIIEVTVALLQNPFAGVGLVLKKINDRVKLEQQAAG